MSMTEIRTIKLNFTKISNVQTAYNFHYRITKYFRAKKNVVPVSINYQTREQRRLQS